MKRLCDGLTTPNDLFDGIPLNFPGVKQKYVEGIRPRIAALRPKGPIATRFLSNNLTVVVVGDSVFAHGGILAEHVAYGLEQINKDVRNWLTGLKDNISSDLFRSRTSIVWNRKVSIKTNGINAVCDGKAVRIDVGMSKGCVNGLPEVLEISGDSGLWVLTSKTGYDSGRQGLVSPVQCEPMEVQVKA
ncbi:hypothetical protein L1987_37648 [Smallanthus sonchifolius]|uniref:Uncharacterized protein n=1 Tax=Smallanthus sonchifolius TaxID=185202 RepID=A0ACB9HIR5_9ASTR|nr:hypothetical protein L1987_37648 [Smallanthus sonchifolius]